MLVGHQSRSLATVGQPSGAGYLGIMLLVFCGPPRPQRCITDEERTAHDCDEENTGPDGDEDSIGSDGAISVLLLPDQVLILVAPVKETGEILQDLGWGVALWGDNAMNGRELPDITTFLLRRVEGIQPTGAAVIPMIDFGSRRQTGVAARDRRGGYDVRLLEGGVSSAVQDAVIDTLSQTLVDFISQPGSTPLVTAINMLEKLEPRNILLTLVDAVTRAIAIHAGLGAIAPIISQFAKNTVSGLIGPDEADRHALVSELKAGLQLEAYVQSGTLLEGVAHLFLTPAIESALKEATGATHWVQGGCDQRGAADSFSSAISTAETLRKRLIAAGIYPEGPTENKGTLENRQAKKAVSENNAIGPAINPPF